nr:MAG TPA: hypothetical protein [Caudoviricetes sp.]
MKSLLSLTHILYHISWLYLNTSKQGNKKRSLAIKLGYFRE